MAARRSKALLEALAIVAPGQPLREGLDRVVKASMGALIVVGDGPEVWTLHARIFPRRFGGLEDLKKLAQARASGKPQYLMRGDGAQMGWVVIEKVDERSTYLDAKGVGQVIEVDISVKRSSKPSNGSSIRH